MSAVTNVKIYDDMTGWTKKHEINTLTATNLLDKQNELGISEELIFNEYFKKQDEIGYEFDFMEGKDANDPESYEKQIATLAQGEFMSKDADKNGEVSLEEYMNTEMEGLTEADGEEMKILTMAYSNLLFKIIDEGMGNSDGSGTLSEAEFASFYKNLDRFQLDENGQGTLTEQYDGKFDIDSASEFPAFLVENIIGSETIDAVINIYAQNN